MRARYRPEYSRIMPSWIIVNSRWVSGLSTGTLPVSAMIATRNAESASRCDGEKLTLWTVAIRTRFVEPAEIAAVKSASIIMGSTRIATVISRLLPSPPKPVPASSPASAMKNRARAKR